MTSQQDQIQSLLAEIDSALQKASPRLPWAAMSGEAAQQRQVLERVRNYLIALQQRLAAEGGLGSASARSVPLTYDYNQPSQPEMTADQMMQTILREMSYLRANLMQPLQVDLEALHQRRERLMQEVQQLEAQRQDYALSQSSTTNQQQLTAELLQVLMSRLQENLSQRIVQTLNTLRNQPGSQGAGPIPSGEAPSASSAHYEQLQALRSRSDQMLVNLDSTLNVIFESLQRNIQSYQESLSQGLERMHSLGQQSEVTFKALVDQFAQQLKEEASSYLVSPGQLAQPDAADSISPTPAPSSVTLSSAAPSVAFPSTTQPGSAQGFSDSGSEQLSPSMSSLDAAIESWLRSASIKNFDTEPANPGEFELAALDLSDLELGAIAADVPVSPSEDREDSGLPAPSDQATSLDSTASLASTDVPLGWETLETIAADFSTDENIDDTTDIDAALNLLEELSAKLETPSESAALDDTDSEFEQLIRREQSPSQSIGLPLGISEDAQIELDEFYQSLFGKPAASDQPEEPEVLESVAPNSADHPAEQVFELPGSLFEDELGQTAQPELAAPPAIEAEPAERPLVQADNVSSLTDLFAGVRTEEGRSVPTDPPAIAGSDAAIPDQLFIDAAQIRQPFPTNNLPETTYTQDSSEDQYTRAAPDENLLPDAPPEAADVNLDLDELTLNRLNEDLSNLENTGAQDARDSRQDSRFELAEPLSTGIGSSEIALNEVAVDQPQSIQPTEESAADAWNTLSLDDLADALSEDRFSSTSAEPTHLPAASAESPLTLEEAGSFFEEAALTNPLPATSSAIAQSSFTLEGMDDLFGDTPSTSPAPLPTPPLPADQPLPFTLEGMDDLFNDALSIDSPTPTVVQPVVEQSTPPPSPLRKAPIKEIPPFKPQLFQPDTPEAELPPFQLEPLDNLYAESPSASVQTSAERTLEHINNLLAEPSTPPVSTPQPPQTQGHPNKRTLDAAFESLLGSSAAATSAQDVPSTRQQTAGKKKGDIAQALQVPGADLQGRNWYLGIDIGTTAISATLLNSQTAQLHPIHWTIAAQEPGQPLFRLPAVAYFAGEQLGDGRSLPASVGYETVPSEGGFTSSSAPAASGLLLHSFKPYLNIAIPYVSPQTQQWEPTIQRSESQEIPLILVQQTLVALLATLTSQPSSASSSLTAAASGLDLEAFQHALKHLAGVIVNHPIGSSDAYCFNLREAVLSAGLVARPEQIFFLEEAVAALLAELHQPNTPAGEPNASLNDRRPSPALKGELLVVSAGAIATDLAVISLPQNGTLTRETLALRRIPYAGNALDQDIICQLLYTSVNQSENLSLADLDLPLPGEPDLETRYHLQQRLESVAFGQQLLNRVKQIKPTLCQRDVSFNLGNRQYVLCQQDLQNWIISPYLQQLNRELNLLLSQSGRSASVILRVLCTGGTTLIPAIAQWLQQKFPNADVVQDIPANADPTAASGNRIASGLALLPRFATILDTTRHQYSDYFLLREVLNMVSSQANRALSMAQVLQMLEKRGINTASCQSFIYNVLEGQLPTGLVPTKASAVVLTPASRQNPDYRALLATPLFSRQDNQTYQVNAQQRDRFRSYLQAILNNTHQALDEPLTTSLITSTVV